VYLISLNSNRKPAHPPARDRQQLAGNTSPAATHALSLITLQRPLLLLLHSSITAIITAATKLLDVHLTGCLAADKILKANKKKEFLVQFAWRDGFPEFMQE
jgi:hypothetical protein